MNIECNYIIPHHEFEKCDLEFEALHAHEPTVRISVAGDMVTLTIEEVKEIMRLSQIFENAVQMVNGAQEISIASDPIQCNQVNTGR